jgi:hypothetical protein
LLPIPALLAVHQTARFADAGGTIGTVTSIWNAYGFRDSPYATAPVPANEEGQRLFVGRSKELRRLGLLLNSAATHPTIEGENGVGKTSLVSVAGY